MKARCNQRYPDIGLNSLILLLLCTAVCLSAVPPTRSWAEIFRWQDENGYWHFTEGTDPGSPTTQHEPAPSKRGQLPEDARTAINSPHEQPVHGGLLWRISSGDHKVSYLLGTIHSEDPRVTRLKPAVARALDASDRFVMEMILDTQAFMQFGAAMVLDQDTDLEKLVGKDTYGRVVSAMADYGMPEPAVRRLKPWVVIAMLSMPKSGGGQILDMALYQRATSQGKPASGLESAKEQLAVFEGLSVQDQIELLEMTLKQLPQQQRNSTKDCNPTPRHENSWSDSTTIEIDAWFNALFPTLTWATRLLPSAPCIWPAPAGSWPCCGKEDIRQNRSVEAFQVRTKQLLIAKFPPYGATYVIRTSC